MLTLQPSCTVVMKSGNLNFLEFSGPLQACNGTALHFTPLKLLCSTSDDEGSILSGTSVYVYQTKLCHVPRKCIVHSHDHENLKSQLYV